MKGRTKPKRLSNSFWGWIFSVFRYTEDELLDTAGLDAVMYLRILSFGAWALWAARALSC